MSNLGPIIGRLVERQLEKADRLADLALFDTITSPGIFDDTHLRGALCVQDPRDVANDLARWEQHAISSSGAIMGVDMAGLTCITSTWWEQVWLRLLTDSRQHGVYPVACNVEPAALADLELVCRAQSTVVAVCRLKNRRLFEPRLVGRLGQREADVMRALLGKPGRFAGELHDECGQGVTVTAINNALATLHRARLVYEVQRGRRKVFFPLLPWSLEWCPQNKRLLVTAAGGEVETR